MSTATASATALTPTVVTDVHRFLFDLNGFILLRGALAEQDRLELLEEVRRIEQLDTDKTDAVWRKPRPDGRTSQPTKQRDPGFLRMNGLFRLSDKFDRLIDYPTVFPLLVEFMGEPQIVNSWSISKSLGNDNGWWHRGVEPEQYSVRRGRIRSRMLNTVYFLTDNGPEDGCMCVIPGGHKSQFDLEWNKTRGLDLPGSVPVVGKAGDILLFSEALLHNGLANTSGKLRTNLYLNYGTRDFNVMTYSPEHNYHFAMPPHVRARWTPQRRAASGWMEHVGTID